MISCSPSFNHSRERWLHNCLYFIKHTKIANMSNNTSFIRTTTFLSWSYIIKYKQNMMHSNTKASLYWSQSHKTITHSGWQSVDIGPISKVSTLHLLTQLTGISCQLNEAKAKSQEHHDDKGLRATSQGWDELRTTLQSTVSNQEWY